VTLDFTRFSLSLLIASATNKEAIAPAHEGLRVDVFVIFGEVKTAHRHKQHDHSS